MTAKGKIKGNNELKLSQGINEFIVQYFEGGKCTMEARCETYEKASMIYDVYSKLLGL